jgi:hypothetical protein
MGSTGDEGRMAQATDPVTFPNIGGGRKEKMVHRGFGCTLGIA